MIPTLVNTLWRAASLGEARRFARSIRRVAESQEERLATYLKNNRDTEYGLRHGFGSIASVAAYQQRVPLTVYDDYLPEIERLKAGQTAVLTQEPVERFELSSGSTSGSKLIPYTATLRAELRRGLAVWIADLYRHYGELLHGPAYWSITPLTEGESMTAGGIAGIPIGFEEDSDYLGPLGPLVESTLAVPNAVKHLREVATFRYVTLLYLLRQPDLRLISVWNPTFLTLLLARLRGWWEPLLRDLAAGMITPPEPVDPAIDPGIWRRLRRRLTPAPRRARSLSRVAPTDCTAIWPRLRLLSCWADGPSAPYAAELARHFPGVTLQPKGLLATEAFVSLPLVGREGAALSTAAHFFELLTDCGEPRLAHQVEKGATYSVVVTTGGGLYRYQLHDVVEVVGFVGEAPCLRFVGKTDQVSDWFGEKLNERFVAGVLRGLFERHRLEPSFALLAPERASGRETGDLRYALYLEAGQLADPAALTAELDRGLSENFHYAYCRRLGQLAPPRIAPVVDGQERYLRACQRQGRKMGNVKPSLLQKTTHWSEWLGAST